MYKLSLLAVCARHGSLLGVAVDRRFKHLVARAAAAALKDEYLLALF
jgi:hypothetical protein